MQVPSFSVFPATFQTKDQRCTDNTMARKMPQRISSINLKRLNLPLLVEEDFGECLDGKSALENLEGLSLEQAYELFLSNPLNYQEDFIFMGSRAFQYYFPVIDRYLREISDDDEIGAEYEDCQASILGYAIEAQFSFYESAFTQGIKTEILQLSAYVQSNVNQYSVSIKSQHRIAKQWKRVDKIIVQYYNNRATSHEQTSFKPVQTILSRLLKFLKWK